MFGHELNHHFVHYVNRNYDTNNDNYDVLSIFDFRFFIYFFALLNDLAPHSCLTA